MSAHLCMVLETVPLPSWTLAALPTNGGRSPRKSASCSRRPFGGPKGCFQLRWRHTSAIPSFIYLVGALLKSKRSRARPGEENTINTTNTTNTTTTTLYNTQRYPHCLCLNRACAHSSSSLPPLLSIVLELCTRQRKRWRTDWSACLRIRRRGKLPCSRRQPRNRRPRKLPARFSTPLLAAQFVFLPNSSPLPH